MAHELGHLGGPHLPKTNNEEIASARENFAGMAVELAGKLAPKPGA
jgi:predicted Zn-dependent protease